MVFAHPNDEPMHFVVELHECGALSRAHGRGRVRRSTNARHQRRRRVRGPLFLLASDRTQSTLEQSRMSS